jgi:glutathione S-transferase
MAASPPSLGAGERERGMTYDLYIGDRSFSSWSLRGWLMLEKFGLPYRLHMVGLYTGTMAQDLAPLAPARLVPVLRTPEGIVVGETLAIAETLAERHPEAGLWPDDPAARAFARWLAAEMHAGFAALRSECPMQLLRVYEGFTPSEALRADLARLETLWSHARHRFGATGPWLFGRYTLADVFFAPAAARIAGYALPASPAAQDYVAAHLADPALRAWRAEGQKVSHEPEPYEIELPSRDWPA